ncbi:acyltransferase family protein [Sphingomonas sp. S1-29]|uniref:acyltransferase family protein n=1 Tax=Sphingomonas sp. S1-29 TaxID=2991074 RepID=UPI00223F9A87|nr:acyltransferase family protein [Sphingomonas sp. S1-29]UZK68680.1 acyltransferase family protein [Sphingomonas sp. S1-29]
MEAIAGIDNRAGQRHYGLDWLRIAAFGLLILYHIGMVFAPWSWVIDTQRSYPALIPPMALLTPWRLALLFAVSGYASRMLLLRSGGVRGFVASRNLRLLVPLAFGMVVLVPIEMWIQIVDHGYPGSYWRFWTRDYWRVGAFWGEAFPSWEHLWFVVYLWAYTMIAAALVARGSVPGGGAVRWLLQGWRLLWVPIAAMGAVRLALLFTVPEQQGLFSDWPGHATFFPSFLFGFTLAAQPRLWAGIDRLWKPALGIAGLAGIVVVATELRYQGETVPPHLVMMADRFARVAMGWAMILALFHLADRHWNRDHRWRRTLGEAVFPFYLVHHVAIVVIAWGTLRWGLGPWAEFAILLGGTAAVCTGFYLVGRRVRWLRPLVGLATSSPAGGGGPRSGGGGFPRPMPLVARPLHHASHGPPPPAGED